MLYHERESIFTESNKSSGHRHSVALDRTDLHYNKLNVSVPERSARTPAGAGPRTALKDLL